MSVPEMKLDELVLVVLSRAPSVCVVTYNELRGLLEAHNPRTPEHAKELSDTIRLLMSHAFIAQLYPGPQNLEQSDKRGDKRDVFITERNVNTPLAHEVELSAFILLDRGRERMKEFDRSKAHGRKARPGCSGREALVGDLMPKSKLNFKTLRERNVQRSHEVFHPIDSWSITDWGCAVAGEAGELCNLLKKIKRGDFPLFDMKKEIAGEIADVVIYLDLLAERCGISLEDAIRDKFNAISEKKKSKVKL